MVRAAALVLALLASPAWAVQPAKPESSKYIWYSMTGNNVIEACDRSPTACQGFVLGVVDGVAAIVSVSDIDPLFCVPDSATKGQVFEVGEKYLRGHPEQRHLAAGALILKAMMDAFPCGPWLKYQR